MINEQTIISSWKINHEPWIEAIRKNQIPSRIAVTNDAIIKAILSNNPKAVLDIGCGEGWLARTLEDSGIDCTGIDVVPELIQSAKNQGKGTYQILEYDELSIDSIGEKFDVIVCNFSLFGQESVNQVFGCVPTLLNKSGVFIIQTLHPKTENDQHTSQKQRLDGWQDGSWAEFSHNFSNPAPWYYRTLDSWKMLFLDNHFQLNSIIEPLDKFDKPASIIFTATTTNT